MAENPTGPYMLQSGRYKGRYLEDLIFNDPEYVLIMNKYRDETKQENAIQRHLHLLMENIPKTAMMCPVCKKRSVKYFLFLNSEDILPTLTCCESAACRESLKLDHPGDYLLPIKFQSMMIFNQKRLRKGCLKLIRKATGLNKKVSPEEVFRIFIGEPLKVV